MASNLATSYQGGRLVQENRMYEVGSRKVVRYLEERGVGEDVVYIPTRLAVCLPSGDHPQPPNGGNMEATKKGGTCGIGFSSNCTRPFIHHLHIHTYVCKYTVYVQYMYTFSTLMKEPSGTKEDSKLRNVSDLL